MSRHVYLIPEPADLLPAARPGAKRPEAVRGQGPQHGKVPMRGIQTGDQAEAGAALAAASRHRVKDRGQSLDKGGKTERTEAQAGECTAQLHDD